MRIGILGTGIVGSTLGRKFVELGHEAKMGSRTPNNPKAVEWAKTTGSKLASHGTFADAAAFGEALFNCTAAKASLEALRMAGEENLGGKILVDVANPMEFTQGGVVLSVCNTDSLAEQIQRAFPEARVVKALNHMNHKIMVNPGVLHGDHDAFISGDDAAAKTEVARMLKEWFGWKSVIDLGGITSARGQEMLLSLWGRLATKYGTQVFSFKVVR